MLVVYLVCFIVKTNTRVDFVTVGPVRAHCYMVWTTEMKRGVLIDPGYDSEKILSMIKKNDVKISFYCYYYYLKYLIILMLKQFI